MRGQDDLLWTGLWKVGAIAGLLFLVVGTWAHAEEVKLDSYRVVGDLEQGSSILVKVFGTDQADFGRLNKKRQQETADNMKSVAPLSLQQSIVQRLTSEGPFSEVAAHPEGEAAADSILVEGEFTVLNPGNRNKRYWVGMGAGKSKVCVEGRVVTGSGELLGTFADCRSGSGMMAFTGGRSEGMMSNDVFKCAVNIAEFMATWAAGQLPTRTKVN
jgi:hypothetical protein